MTPIDAVDREATMATGADRRIDRSAGMNRWPDLDLPTIDETLETLHLWTQVVGKVKLATLPWLNESWHVPLSVSAAGLTTGLLTPGDLGFALDLDFRTGALVLTTSDGQDARVPLAPMSVADFHGAVTNALATAGIDVAITPRPSEIAGAPRFVDDTAARVFDLAAARAWWLALIQVQRVFHRFRSRFTGKCSPIHLFWGSFDLAVTRFSGRPAPLVTRGGPNMSVAVAQDAYADEQAGCGFWHGGGGVEGPHFYLEAWPEPDSFKAADVGPPGARFDETLGKWLLGYATVRDSEAPDDALLAFLQSGYDAIADLGDWPRDRLERDEGPIGHPPPLRRGSGD